MNVQLKLGLYRHIAIAFMSSRLEHFLDIHQLDEGLVNYDAAPELLRGQPHRQSSPQNVCILQQRLWIPWQRQSAEFLQLRQYRLQVVRASASNCLHHEARSGSVVYLEDRWWKILALILAKLLGKRYNDNCGCSPFCQLEDGPDGQGKEAISLLARERQAWAPRG